MKSRDNNPAKEGAWKDDVDDTYSDPPRPSNEVNPSVFVGTACAIGAMEVWYIDTGPSAGGNKAASDG